MVDIIDDFERNELEHYIGDDGTLDSFDIDGTNSLNGDNYLRVSSNDHHHIRSESGLPNYPVRGDFFRVWFYPTDTDNNWDEMGFKFGVDESSDPIGDAGSNDNDVPCYRVDVSVYTDEDAAFKIVKDGNTQETVGYEGWDLPEWYLVDVHWSEDNGNITAKFYSSGQSDGSNIDNPDDPEASSDLTEEAELVFADNEYDDGAIGWYGWCDEDFESGFDYAHIYGTEAPDGEVAGSVTLDDTEAEGAVILAINQTTGEIEGVTESESDGTYTISGFDDGDLAHVAAKLKEDDGSLYYDFSAPYVDVTVDE